MIVEPRIIVGLVLIAVFGASFILIDRLDPYYRTDQVISSEIISSAYFAGKQGSTLKVTVKTLEGETYTFSQSQRSKKRIGDKVKLRLYKRKITGLGKYEPEWH